MKNDPGQTELEAYLRPYRFDLPERLIARRPAARRDGSRLLVLDRTTGALSDRAFSDLPDLLRPDDLLIRNATRVSPRRLRLRRASGAQIETLFLRPVAESPTPETTNASTWVCLIKNARKIKDDEILPGPDTGTRFRFTRAGPHELRMQALDHQGRPAWTTTTDAERFFARHGEIPLPPYLGRAAEAADSDRYQTVYARGEPGSVAAPTAGLHFTPELLGTLETAGVRMATLELLISYGTFAPLERENFDRGSLHPEWYTIAGDFPTGDWPGDPDGPTGNARRRIAVGTTSLRALEDNLRRHGDRIAPGSFETSLFIKPPDTCRSTEGLLTNFHLPGSSLLMLVCAFGGTEAVLAAYAHAVREEYRFYSYGDAMLIV